MRTLKASQGVLTDHRSTCKLCRLAITKDHQTVWLTKPIGLSHEKCAQDREGK